MVAFFWVGSAVCSRRLEPPLLTVNRGLRLEARRRCAAPKPCWPQDTMGRACGCSHLKPGLNIFGQLILGQLRGLGVRAPGDRQGGPAPLFGRITVLVLWWGEIAEGDRQRLALPGRWPAPLPSAWP